MESRNKFEMCRLCLCENECFVNIFEMNDWQGYVAAEVISDLLQFQVSETDGYTHVVCLTCLTKLTDFRLFKECCQKSKVTYDNLFASHESLVEHKPEMVEFVAVKTEPTYYSDNEDNDSKSLEQTRPYCTSLGAVDADSCTRTTSSHEESVFEKSMSTSISVKVEAISSGTMEGSEGAGERIYKATLNQQDVSIAKERSGDDEDKEGEGERPTFPEKEVKDKRERFECYYCGILIKTKDGLKKHMVFHGFGKSYDCEVCGKVLQSNSIRIIHMRSHTGCKTYECAECGKGFSQNSHLRNHMRTHTGSKPYKCAECGKSFSENGTLKRHMRTHTGSKPYKCSECMKCFSENGSLKKHMRMHADSKPHTCAECGKRFRETGKLNEHMRIHTGVKPYTCSECSRSFNQKSNLNRHMKSHRL